MLSNKPTATIVDFRGFFPPHIVAFTTDRTVDFSLIATTGLLSREQKQFLRESCGVPLDDAVVLKQVHGNRVITVSEKDFHKIHQADGAATNAPGVALSVRTADCLPVFLFDPVHNAMCLVHAGWNGSRKKIITHATRHMTNVWNTKPRELRVALGPGIRACCYRVGAEFKDFFSGDEIIEKDGALYLDLALCVRNQLCTAGVTQKNITDCGICTFCDTRFFSYRREGAGAGRMVSVMLVRL